MSNADKLFYELGYRKIEENEDEMELYKKELFTVEESCFGKDFIEICFDKIHRLLNIRSENVSQFYTITSILNMQELKAINTKCLELGWLGDTNE